MDDTRWELRSALRWGSRHAGYAPTREAAVDEANRRIAAKGARGAIEHIDLAWRIVYYTEHEEES